MFRVTRTFTRPNTSIPFHPQAVDGTYFKQTYIDTGKIVWLNNRLSEDGLTFYHEAFWENETTFNLHKEDPNIIEYFRLRDLHNSGNGITATQTVTETISDV